MKIVLGRFIKKKDEFDSENIVCPIKGYDRDKYLNRRIFFRILFILIYGFGLGYIIGLASVTIHDVKVIIFNFILFVEDFICMGVFSSEKTSCLRRLCPSSRDVSQITADKEYCRRGIG